MIIKKNDDRNLLPTDVIGSSVARSKRWLVAIVRICHEKKTGERLTKMGIENFLPIQQEVHQWSDRRKIVDRVLAPLWGFSVPYRGNVPVRLFQRPYRHPGIRPGRTSSGGIPYGYPGLRTARTKARLSAHGHVGAIPASDPCPAAFFQPFPHIIQASCIHPAQAPACG